MTTAAAPRRPSPADMARTTSAAADRRLTAPGTAPQGSAYRALYERGILASDMTSNARYVAIALATHADAAGQIARQPRLVGLVHDTGLHAGQVVVALTTLRQRGWLRQTNPAASYERADLVLTIPNQVMARLLKKSSPQTVQPTN
ncbi:hypothetical protein ACFWNI_33630 [Streptomyces sp. NPDC058377]|uniref:hypothetical protein n=1 Tax=Streptomyces sp. NPDC058377 TaxID=3346468 RepID=UPI00364FF361